MIRNSCLARICSLRRRCGPSSIHIPLRCRLESGMTSGPAQEFGQTLEVNPGLDTLPVYVRAGSIIPEQPVVQNTDEIPQGPLTLNVYPGPQCHGSLYADDGNTLAYEHGDIVRVSFTCEAKSDRIDVSISAPDGLYEPWFHEAQINIYGVTQNVSSVTADSRSLMGWTQKSGVLTLPAIKWTATPHHFSVAMTAAHQ